MMFFRLLIALFIPAAVHATDSYLIDAGASQTIDEFGTCKSVTNNKSTRIYVPTLYTAEWTSFFTNPPSNVAVNACTSGYFVMSNATYNGNRGGLSGADSDCWTAVNGQNWKDKASAGALTADRVRAFLCAGFMNCNFLLPDLTYKFAVAADTSPGGGSFTTDTSAAGPNDNADWSGASYFGGTFTYWVGRSAGTATKWGNGALSNVCSGFASTAGNGIYGTSNSTTATRWNNGTQACTTNARLICMVDPYVVTRSLGSGFTSTSGTSSSISPPAGYAAGDVYFYIAAGNGGFAGVTSAPAGWTRARLEGPTADGAYIDVWYKTLTGSEPGSYSFTHASGNLMLFNPWVRKVGGTPIVTTSGQTTAASATAGSPSLTTTQPHQLIFHIVGASQTISALPAGMTSGSSGNIGALYAKMGERYVSAAGATGALNSTLSASGNSVVVNVVVSRP